MPENSRLLARIGLAANPTANVTAFVQYNQGLFGGGNSPGRKMSR